MPLLALFLGNFFTGLITWLAAYVGRKAAVTAIVVAASVAAVTALFTAVSALVSNLLGTIANEGLFHWLLVGLNFALPSNFFVCLWIMLAADVYVFLYRFVANRVTTAAIHS
jgi:chromate transport protein ChrA